MPFKSRSEYDDMMENDPKRAAMFVKHAKQAGKPIVSKSNPGYGKPPVEKKSAMSAAAKRRLIGMKKDQKDPEEKKYNI